MNVGYLLSWIVCGLIVGCVARLLVQGWHHFGLVATLILGLVGALVGGLLSWLIWGASGEPFSLSSNAWPGWIMAILWAVLALWVYGRLYHRRWWQR